MAKRLREREKKEKVHAGSGILKSQRSLTTQGCDSFRLAVCTPMEFAKDEWGISLSVER